MAFSFSVSSPACFVLRFLAGRVWQTNVTSVISSASATAIRVRMGGRAIDVYLAATNDVDALLRSDHQTVQLQERRIGLLFRRIEIARSTKSLRVRSQTQHCTMPQAIANVRLKMPDNRGFWPILIGARRSTIPSYRQVASSFLPMHAASNVLTIKDVRLMVRVWSRTGDIQ